ncbi:FKBP-type peptidyl-prolyl cis-trans isomerase [Neolewinella persica]|uniref:FKBP-type peptidyl-prolyl cis-trans isomerase n=1 Tax=Neolewinella persica TaxID=70998 RepID=UPI0003689EB7|nr:FKBP-type peptidyl-prolyl cis-trans isomerase [Neolewinella persica]
MKQFIIGIVLCLSFGPLSAQNNPTKMDSTFYALGILMSENLTEQFGKLDVEELARGLRAAQDGSATMDAQKANATVQAFMMKKQESAGAEARQEGEDFLANNAKRAEVMVTESGLQYEVLKEGEGTSPTATETVEVHYHGTLLDGTVFDSSVDRGETIEFPLNRVIPGWTEGVQLMKPGAKYRFYIPFDLAYGPRGSAPKIPPYAALIFEVELFKVK